MTNTDHFTGQAINNESQLKVALYKTRKLCVDLGFNDVVTSKITTSASELVRNVLKYAGNGYICLSLCKDGLRSGLQIVVCDNGPGIEDIEQAMQDKFSSSGTLGLGLPGVKRMMDEFDIASSKDSGTKVTIRKYL